MSRKRYYGLAQAKRASQMKAYGSSPRVSYSSGTNSSGHIDPGPRITGALLAANVFGAYGDDSVEDCVELESSDKFDSDNLVPDGEYQLEFELFNKEEIEQDLRQVIRRYENALEKMGMAALHWHWLQEDVEKYGQIEKMFKDMQLCRRLCGGGPPNDLDEYNERY